MKVSFSSSSAISKAPGFGPTPPVECPRQVAARACAIALRSAASIFSTLSFQLRSRLHSHASRTPSSPSFSLTNEISPAIPSTSMSCMNWDSCFSRSQRLFASSRSPRSIASVAQSIVGRDISRSSSSENHLSDMTAPSLVRFEPYLSPSE